MTRWMLAVTMVIALVALAGRDDTRPIAAAILALAGFASLAWVAAALRRRARQRTLDRLRAMTPAAFERTVAAWFARDGWLVEHRGRSGDPGIDVLAFRGRETVAVQCKRYAGAASVTPAQLRELYGAAVAAGATGALMVTTGRVSRAAAAWAANLPGTPAQLDVIAGDQLEAIAAGRRRIAAGDDRAC